MGEPTLWRRIRGLIGSFVFDLYLWINGWDVDDFRASIGVCDRDSCKSRDVVLSDAWEMEDEDWDA